MVQQFCSYTTSNAIYSFYSDTTSNVMYPFYSYTTSNVVHPPKKNPILDSKTPSLWSSCFRSAGGKKPLRRKAVEAAPCRSGVSEGLIF